MEKIAHGISADRNMRRQPFDEVVEGRIGMVGDELPHFLFVRSEFLFSTGSRRTRSDLTRLASPLEKGVEPRAADGVVRDNIVDRYSAIVVVQYPQTQVKGIRCCHRTPP
jgi:hypothetical protein